MSSLQIFGLQVVLSFAVFSLLATSWPGRGRPSRSSPCAGGRPPPSRLPGFRNVLIHEYVALDMARVVEALGRLEPIERFSGIVRAIAETGGS
jgi:hypothetical protein